MSRRILLAVFAFAAGTVLLGRANDSGEPETVLVLLLFLVLLLAVCCGKKRPPAPASQPGADGTCGDGQATDDSPVVRCQWCARAVVRDEPHCRTCGGSVMPTGPCLLECGWCGLSNRRDRTATCIGCGGPLPAIPGAQAGPRPPEAPRALPAGYRGRVLWRKNVSVVIGLGFLFGFGFSLVLPFAGVEPVLYLPFLPFVAAGAVLFATGRRRALRRLKALEHGMVAEGRIVSLEHDRTQSINGVSPWQIRFEYRTQAGPLCGVVEGWDPAHAGRTVGEPVFVVHLAGKPHIHALWPPVY